MTAAPGATELTLLHDAGSMGWRVGDRIVVAPNTADASEGTAEACARAFQEVLKVS